MVAAERLVHNHLNLVHLPGGEDPLRGLILEAESGMEDAPGNDPYLRAYFEAIADLIDTNPSFRTYLEKIIAERDISPQHLGGLIWRAIQYIETQYDTTFHREIVRGNYPWVEMPDNFYSDPNSGTPQDALPQLSTDEVQEVFRPIYRGFQREALMRQYPVGFDDKEVWKRRIISVLDEQASLIHGILERESIITTRARRYVGAQALINMFNGNKKVKIADACAGGLHYLLLNAKGSIQFGKVKDNTSLGLITEFGNSPLQLSDEPSLGFDLNNPRHPFDVMWRASGALYPQKVMKAREIMLSTGEIDALIDSYEAGGITLAELEYMVRNSGIGRYSDRERALYFGDVGQSEFPNVEFRRANIYSLESDLPILPAESEDDGIIAHSYDAAIIGTALYQMSDPERALENLNQLVQRKGITIIMDNAILIRDEHGDRVSFEGALGKVYNVFVTFADYPGRIFHVFSYDSPRAMEVSDGPDIEEVIRIYQERQAAVNSQITNDSV